MPTLERAIRAVWTLPNTLLGLLLGLLSFQLPRRAGGALAFDGSPRGFLWLFDRGPHTAITFGQVILSAKRLEGPLLAHELHHVRQYEILGPLFLPSYLGIWLARGYRGHPLEEAAKAEAGRAQRR